jgi:hypothetical protein
MNLEEKITFTLIKDHFHLNKSCNFLTIYLVYFYISRMMVGLER